MAAAVSSSMSVAKAIRILLVDEHAMVREGLRLVIESNPAFIIAGETGDRADALETARRENPDIILIDPSLDANNGYSIIAELRAAAGNARVIILTEERSPEIQRSAIVQGAKGAVCKREASETLIKAIKRVVAGEMWLERSFAASLFSDAISNSQERDSHAARIATLTQREREVVGLVAEGLKNKQVGHQLSITESTVSHHLTSVFAKLGLSDRLQLIAYAHRQGLIKRV